MQDKDFDQLFKERFEAFEVGPSDSVWQRISKQIDTPVQKKKKTFTPYWMAAASVVLLTSAVLWLKKPGDVIKLQGKSQGQVVVIQKKEAAKEAKPVESKAIDKPAGKIIAQRDEQEHLVSRKAAKSEVTQSQTKLPERIIPQTPTEDEMLLANQKVITEVKKLEKAPAEKENEVVMAQIDESEVETYSETEATKPRIKSIGGLVNFVVAQVDKRDDKIIEFEDTEEGSAVSGINLGPLKFKSRKK